MDDWIEELWDEQRPSAVAKVARIAAVVPDATAGTLDDERREEATAVAHQLAGSLGTYGRHDAAQAASDAERLLKAPPVDADALAGAVKRMEDAVAER